MQKLKIHYPRYCNEYYLHYDWQPEPQPIGVELDPEFGTLGIYCDKAFDEEYDVAVLLRQNRMYRIEIGPETDPRDYTIVDLRKLLDRILPIAQRITDGYKCDEDTWVGVLTTPEAQEAFDELKYIVSVFKPHERKSKVEPALHGVHGESA